VDLSRNPNVPDAGKAALARRGMFVRNRLLFFLVAWLIVLMPVLFWWNTWFGRQLSDKQMSEYLNDEKHPRHIQHALVQLGERMTRHDPGASRWYPELLRLASNPVEEVRNTDAWVMGQDTAGPGFHEMLLKMLGDSSALVRGNAALSLVRFGDASGHDQIVALLQHASIVAPTAGRLTDIDKVATTVHQGGLIAKLQSGQQTIEIRSPINGRIQNVPVAPGTVVAAGTEVARLAPAADQIWEALRALYFIGRADDLPAIRSYEGESPEISDRVRQQAMLTEKATRQRADAQQR
jgi:biotin carboxyl carrier protein